MTKFDDKFAPFEEKMLQAGRKDLEIQKFRYYYNQLLEGYTGLIQEADILPVEKLQNSETFSSKLAETGQKNLSKVVLLKLNGGLGTSMGMNKTKSLLHVKNRMSFLDIIVHQVQQAQLPLVLMNSFITKEESLSAIKPYHLKQNIPLDFVQHKVPKVVQSDFSPAVWPDNPILEWCPPGHGDIYTAMVTSEILDKLLTAGYQYIFISNSDNLGATIDTTILGYLITNKLSFLMEVADRTPADRKGGHLAQQKNGQLILRELAQCPENEQNSFQNIKKYKYFNTNNLWVDLIAFKKLIQSQNYILDLPMIRNKKTIDPRNSNSTPVYQLETAMGTAISVFKNTGAVRVPRSRFLPVKTTNDLLAIRSDIYQITKDYRIIQNPNRKFGQIIISLDPKEYKLIHQMEAKFAQGVPSLIDCQRLEIKGNFKFGKNIVMKGSVKLINNSNKQISIKDNTVIEGEHLVF